MPLKLIKEVLQANINNVYIASVWMLVDTKVTNSRSFFDFDTILTSRYVKKTLIYYKNQQYYDLITGNKMKTSVTFLDIDGTQFVNLKDNLIPLTDVVDYKRQNMSKRKIIKKYNEIEKRGKYQK